MRSFSTGGIGKKGGSGVDFFKKSCNSQDRKADKIQKNVEMGRKKVISGYRDHHPGRNCAANAMECLPDPKAAKKKSKIAKKPKNPENPGFPYLPIKKCLRILKQAPCIFHLIPSMSTCSHSHSSKVSKSVSKS